MHLLPYCRVEQQPIHYKLHWGLQQLLYSTLYLVHLIVSYRIYSHWPYTFLPSSPLVPAKPRIPPLPKSWSSLAPSAEAATAAENERSRWLFFYSFFFKKKNTFCFHLHLFITCQSFHSPSRANSFVPVSAMVDVQDANAVSYTKLHALAMIDH